MITRQTGSNIRAFEQSLVLGPLKTPLRSVVVKLADGKLPNTFSFRRMPWSTGLAAVVACAISSMRPATTEVLLLLGSGRLHLELFFFGTIFQLLIGKSILPISN